MSINDWASVTKDALVNTWDRSVTFVPNLLGGILIALFGVIVAVIIGYIVTLILRAIKLQTLSDQLNVTEALKKAKLDTDVSKLAGNFIKWVIIFTFLIPAASVLQIIGVKDYFEYALSYIPTILGVLLFVVIGLKIAEFLSYLVRVSFEGFGLPWARFSEILTRVSVVAVIGILAMFSLGVPREFTIYLFLAVALGGAIALGLSAGLGGKDHMDDLFKTIRERLKK